MARFGIVSKKAYGISAPALRNTAHKIGTDHLLAQQLWKTGILEARILASLIADPALVTERQMERWVKDFDNWAVCDAACGNLFDKTPLAWKKAKEWSRREPEFVKRASFSLMAYLASHNKEAKDSEFNRFFPLIKREARDDRNFVKKAINWALRQMGKRNLQLNKKAILTAREMQRIASSSARWIAADALRELTSDAVQRRLRRRKK